MSFDFRLERVCPHYVFEERLSFEDDLQTIRPKQPFSNQFVSLRLNGFEAPPNHPRVGFRLIRDTQSTDPSARLIKLVQPRDSTDDLVEATYFTAAQNCRRCMGLRVEKDLQYNNLGNLRRVRDEEKLLQDIEKIVVTELGSNPFHPWFGTSILRLIGGKIQGAVYFRSRVGGEIRTALQNYDSVQKQQSERQLVTDQERYARILSLEILQNDFDPTAFEIDLTVQNREGALVELRKRLSIPGPQALLFNTPAGELEAQLFTRRF